MTEYAQAKLGTRGRQPWCRCGSHQGAVSGVVVSSYWCRHGSHQGAGMTAPRVQACRAWSSGRVEGGVEEIDPEVEGFTGGGNVVSFKNNTEDAVKRGSTETHTAELQARVSRSCEF
ncbi:hypothetical protein V6N13_052217 [Hibiscus sabdariffa]